MIEHEPISPPLTLPAQGQDLALFREFQALPDRPPGEWTRSVDGDPLWILKLPYATWGPWFSVITAPHVASSAWHAPWMADAARHGPIAMPHLNALVREQRGEHEDWMVFAEQVRTAKTDHEREQIAKAWTPPHGRGRAPIRLAQPERVRAAAWLSDGLGLGHLAIADIIAIGGTNERTARRHAVRYVQAGRKLLNDLGVLPWTLWADGQVPKDWWQSNAFVTGIYVWGWIVRSRSNEIDAVRNLSHEVAAATRVLGQSRPT